MKSPAAINSIDICVADPLNGLTDQTTDFLTSHILHCPHITVAGDYESEKIKLLDDQLLILSYISY